MGWKGFLLGLALGATLLFALGARQLPNESADGRRYQLFIDKTPQGKDYWTIFDAENGVARIYREDGVHRVSFAEDHVQKVK